MEEEEEEGGGYLSDYVYVTILLNEMKN